MLRSLRAVTDGLERFPTHLAFWGPHCRRPLFWNFMKIVSIREAAARREPRTQTPQRVALSPARPAQSEWAWPGMTRAALRAEIIDQIG